MNLSWIDIACCPRCHEPLTQGEAWLCSNRDCAYWDLGFPVVSGKPALIDFDQSIFSRGEIIARRGSSILNRTRFTKKIQLLLLYNVHRLEQRAEQFGRSLLENKPGARLLVIGGGEIGAGMRVLYQNRRLDIIATDVYASPMTDLLADGHALPFLNETFDGVWIQAVLEHVLDPAIVVGEIHRVLKRDGIVFADTPFMQQVHEGAYDFTRFTMNGYRWLFRRFETIEINTTAGAGTALVWSIRYFVRALTGSNKLSTLVSLCFFWLRFFDGLTKKRPNADAASGIHFIGRKSSNTIRPLDLVQFYNDYR